MNVVAQKENATKIVGCWILKKMAFSDPKMRSAEIEAEAKDSEVCFTAGGKFATTKPGNDKSPITGTFAISEDGTTLTQKRDQNEEGVEDDATIVVLNDQELVFATEFGKMYFVRKKD
jgi:hypothetical protein